MHVTAHTILVFCNAKHLQITLICDLAVGWLTHTGSAIRWSSAAPVGKDVFGGSNSRNLVNGESEFITHSVTVSS